MANLPKRTRDCLWSWRNKPGAGSNLSGRRDHGVSTRSREVGRAGEEEANMSDRSTKKLVREGDFVAEVDVRLIDRSCRT